MWCAAAGDPYPMEKNPDDIPMFARFVERGLALPTSDFFKGLLKYYGIEYLNLNQGSQNRYNSSFQIQRNRTGKPTKPTG
jgi:hypothetical protein